jgi:hypothetical protein
MKKYEVPDGNKYATGAIKPRMAASFGSEGFSISR